MVRRRLKHKEVVETIHKDDFDVIKESFQEFWTNRVRRHEGFIWTTLIVVFAVAAISIVWQRSQSNSLVDANTYLAEAKTRFDSGDTVGALQELDYILDDGKYADPRVTIAAEMVRANIAMASGEYETAISVLNRSVAQAPENLKPDLLYQLATAQEGSGDYEGAEETLEKIIPFLGEEPSSDDPYRESSLWDRYYFYKGRLLARAGKRKEAVRRLLMVSERSLWSENAKSELAWIQAQPVESLPTPWNPSQG